MKYEYDVYMYVQYVSLGFCTVSSVYKHYKVVTTNIHVSVFNLKLKFYILLHISQFPV